MRRKHSPTSLLVIGLLLSVIIHLSFWIAMMKTKANPVILKKNDHVQVEILDKKDQTKFAQVEKKKIEKQIVEQSKKAINDETPDQTKFLSRHNQTVAHQTRARFTGRFRNSGGQGLPTPPRQQLLVDKQASPHARHKALKNVSLQKLLPQYRPHWHKRYGQQNRPLNHPGLASQTDDHLPGVDEGLQTLLSTREFVYYAYYQRIRERIRQYWEPEIKQKVEKIFASGRSIASTRDHITKVIIVLDRHGVLVKVQVVGESGVRDLDDAAVDAFKAAEPFPNPPKGIIGKDGYIRIRWDFVLQASLVQSPRPHHDV